MKRLIALLLLITVLTGCSSGLQETSTENVKETLITDIKGNNDLDNDGLKELLTNTFDGIYVICKKQYGEQAVILSFDWEYDIEKTQEKVDSTIMETALMLMTINQYIATNYKEECAVQVEFKINDAEVKYYTRTTHLNYLEGDNNYDLLMSYMSKVNVLVSGKVDIRDSVVKSLKKQFSIYPEYV